MKDSIELDQKKRRKRGGFHIYEEERMPRFGCCCFYNILFKERNGREARGEDMREQRERDYFGNAQK
jgi:hypothetical protein